MLSASGISFRAGKATLLHDTSLRFEPGLFHVIMGPNGAGKSTLLKILSGEQEPATGEVSLNEKLLRDYTKKELAVTRAVLSQHYHLSFPIQVKDIVMMGRYPYFGSRPSGHDIEICRKCMEDMDVIHLEERDFGTLSGGEAQKVQMSRVLAQIGEGAGKVLFLDEPVSHLDMRFQHQLLKAARSLTARGVTIVAILHDLNLAMAYADRLICIKKGQLVFDDTDLTALTIGKIQEVFDIEARILNDGEGRSFILFH